jgi:hypothetical protein
MTKSTKQINKEADVSDNDSSPAVVAYRMSQLERTVKEGFDSHNSKLDSLISNFATKEELSALKSQLNDWRWYFRALVTAVLLALGTGLAGLVIKK